MFSHLGVYLTAEQSRHISLPKSVGVPNGPPTSREVELPAEIAVFLRLAIVIVVVAGGLTLAMWVAG